MKYTLILFFTIFSILQESALSQNYNDSLIFPAKKEYLIKLLQNASEEELKKEPLHLEDKTAKTLSSNPNRRNISKIEDLKEILPYNCYIDIENKVNLWINNTTNVQNVSGGNKITIINYLLNERLLGFGLLGEVGYGTVGYGSVDGNHEFLALPYGAFFRIYILKRFPLELQYCHSVFSFNDDLAFISTGVKSGELYTKFAYHDWTALLNFTSIRSNKSRFRAFGGAKISKRISAEFEMTRTQSSFVGVGELPTLSQYTSVVFGYGFEFGGSGHKLPLITAVFRVDLGTNNIMRDFIIQETNTPIEFGKVSCLGLQVGIGF